MSNFKSFVAGFLALVSSVAVVASSVSVGAASEQAPAESTFAVSSGTDGAAGVALTGQPGRAFAIWHEDSTGVMSIDAVGQLGGSGGSTVLVSSDSVASFTIAIESGDGEWLVSVADPFNGFAWDR